MPVMRALRVMRNERALLAIVIDGAGRPIGIVTIKDVVEHLTGELPAW
jgi:CBS domain containing-hemolysin-like protein